jgi:lipid-binding SYLF domain-containing protein
MGLEIWRDTGGTMKISRYLFTIAAAAVFTMSGAAAFAQTTPSSDPKIEKKRGEIRKMAQETLTRLYKAEPTAKSALERSAGHAVFSNTGIKILLGGSGKGQGVAVNNQTRKEVFMKMLEVQVGLGVGVKKFNVIFLFETEDALNKFVNSGWEMGAQADAAATAGEGKGGGVAGAVSVSDGVWMYQLTDKGISLSLTAKGTKYSKDGDLNK